MARYMRKAIVSKLWAEVAMYESRSYIRWVTQVPILTVRGKVAECINVIYGISD